MGLLGKKLRRLATNAPHTWPHLEVEMWSDDNPAVNCLSVSAALAKNLPDAKLVLYEYLLYDDGILTVPVIVQQGEQRTAVFAYGQSNAEAAAHYSAVRALLRQRESLNAVYYAPEAIAPAKAAVALEPLDTKHFSRPDAEPAPAEYSVWWSTPEDPTLAASPALAHLDRWFAALDGYTPFVFSALLNELEQGEDDDEHAENPKLVAPPDQPLITPVSAPGHVAMCLHAASGEGLWLAADTQRTSPAKRNALLKQLADLAEELRRTLQAESVPLIEDNHRGLAFWQGVREEALRKEQTPDAGLHVLTIRDSWRLPAATTAEERAKNAAAQPDESAVEFAGQQLDFAMAALERVISERAGVASEEPNLQPFLAMRVGGDVLRTTLPYCTPDDAPRLIPDLIAARGAVDVAALVYDAYVREGEARTDAVFVRVEKRGEENSKLFVQRYKSGPFEAVGNWALMAREPSLFPTGSEAEVSAPPVALQTFVSECMREALHMVMAGNESAEEREDDGALSSPSLYLRVDGQTLTHRLMLGGLAWAVDACSKILSEQPKAQVAVFFFDDLTTRNGEPAHALRFRAQERGAPQAFEFTLAYAKPVKGQPFKTIGALDLLGTVTPLFPASGPAAPEAPNASGA
jgi:hypothetical protein